MSINEKQAQYMITILNEGSISAAARKLFISQPSLSQTVRQVEHELGLPIFDRGTDPISLTAAGERYIEAARKMLQLTKNLQKAIREIQNENTGVIRFGIPVQRGLKLLPRIIPAFYKAYPKVELSLTERGSMTIHELLLGGELDLGILTTIPSDDRLNYILLDQENIVLLCDRSTELAKRIPDGTPISIAEAKDELFVSNFRGHNISLIQNELFAAAGISPRVLCTSSNISNCQRITVHAGAVMLCPDSYIDPDSEIRRKGAVYPVRGIQEQRSCYLCYRKDLYLSKYIRALIGIITATCAPRRMPHEVSIAEMLAARDRRAELQQQLLAEQHAPLVSMTLNIPGPHKVFEGIPYAYTRGIALVKQILDAHDATILSVRELREVTGYEAFFSVSADADALKAYMCEIEEAAPIGRLFDIDVLSLSGEKLSRTALGLPMRRCLLCGEPAHACARSRRHSVAALTERIRKLIYLDFLENCCRRAILGEVETTPKPGLVDRRDSGAHKDMDIHTFERSTEAILPYLMRMAECGWDFAREAVLPQTRGSEDMPSESQTGQSGERAPEPAAVPAAESAAQPLSASKEETAQKPMAVHPLGISTDATALPALFDRIRPIGVEAERAMFEATGGVNTHRGMIFTIGILIAAAAYVQSSSDQVSGKAAVSMRAGSTSEPFGCNGIGRYDAAGSLAAAQSERLFAVCRDMTKARLSDEFLHIDRAHPNTHGELLFVEHGYRGIRGEASEGFPSVHYTALPVYAAAMENHKDPQRAALEALIALMSNVYDTTVLYRTSHDCLLYMQNEAQKLAHALAMGLPTQQLSHRLYEMNRDFTEKNISPGGCADLLAATIFVYLLGTFA